MLKRCQHRHVEEVMRGTATEDQQDAVFFSLLQTLFEGRHFTVVLTWSILFGAGHATSMLFELFSFPTLVYPLLPHGFLITGRRA